MKIYKCRCHVCGNKFDYESSFLSCGYSDSDGRLSISCNVDSELPQHTAQQVREAFLARYQGKRVYEVTLS